LIVALPSFLLRFRNKLLTDPKFLAFAQRFPLTRPVARRKSVDLFDLLAGFSYSQVLYTCVTLRVFERVGVTGVGRDQLQASLGLPASKAELLIKAAIALDLLALDNTNIVLGSQGAALLGQPWIMRFVEHHRFFYRDLEDPVAMLKGEFADKGLRSYWSYEAPDADKSGYSALMAASQAAVSAQILGAYKFPAEGKILDVGGGVGAFLKAVGDSYPQLERHLFDLPGVVALAKDAALHAHAGDFRLDDLPSGMDVITLVRVVHDHDDDVVLALLKNIRRACSIKTVLLIAEPFAGNPATARVTDAYFNLYFAAMGQGRTRSPREIAALAEKAGFGSLRVWPTHMPLITGLVSFKPI
jgi:demethylspheroidene O-methyltransferase